MPDELELNTSRHCHICDQDLLRVIVWLSFLASIIIIVVIAAAFMP